MIMSKNLLISTLVTISAFDVQNVEVSAVDKNRLAVVGGRLVEDGREVITMPGPHSGVSGFHAELPVKIELFKEFGPKGSLMFWFKPDREYLPGKGVGRESIPLVALGEVVRVSLEQQGNAINFFARWDDSVDTAIDRHIRVLMPGFPGGAWHHFALHWDEKEGLINAFLDGTPFYWTDQRVTAWTNPSSRTLTLHADRFAIAEVQLEERPFAPDDLQSIVGQENLGKLNALLGSQNLGMLNTDSLNGQTLYKTNMASAANMEGWRLEGPGEVTYEDGWMVMQSLRPDGPEGHVVIWCPVDFPDNFAAEWEFQLLSEEGLCIAFFSAKGRNGEDIFDPSLQPREGIFGRYVEGDIDSYHISYFADTPLNPRRTTNLRKNHGLNLVASGPAGVQPNSSANHKVTLVKQGSRIRMAVDGRLIIDFADDGKTFGPALRDGKIGLRQMQWTKGRYRNFRVSELAITDSPQPNE